MSRQQPVVAASSAARTAATKQVLRMLRECVVESEDLSFGHHAGGYAEERDFSSGVRGALGGSFISQEALLKNEISAREHESYREKVCGKVCRHHQEEEWLKAVLRAVRQVPETCHP